MKKIIISIIMLLAGCIVGSLMAQTHSEVTLPTLQEAIEVGLKNNYDIKINQRSVEISKGEKQAAKGAFDPILAAKISAISGVSHLAEMKNPQHSELSLLLPTQWGVNATTGLSYSRISNIIYPVQSANGAWIQLDLPILKGLGKTNKNFIDYQVAKLNLDATQANFDYEIMRFIKDAALAYLNVFYKNQAYNTQSQIIIELEEYKNSLQLKIDNNTVPATEIINISTELAQIKSDRSTSFAEVKNAYVAYLQILGLESAPLDMDCLLTPFIRPILHDERMKNYVSNAIFRKNDIVHQSPAFKKQEIMEASLLQEATSAKYEKRHDLQLQLRYNYNHYSESDHGISNPFWGYPQSVFFGSTYLLTLSYKLPIGNNTAKGNYLSKINEYESQKTVNDQLVTEMENNIEIQSNNLLNSIEVLDMQKEITKFREQVYHNEVLKYDQGNSTQIDVINSHREYMEAALAIHSKEYIVISNWLNMKFLCNDIPQNAEQLTSLLN
jgi:outer membrane protein TolC